MSFGWVHLYDFFGQWQNPKANEEVKRPNNGDLETKWILHK